MWPPTCGGFSGSGITVDESGMGGWDGCRGQYDLQYCSCGMQRMLDSSQALCRVGADERHRLDVLMHDCTIDGVDYLTELPKWMSIVFRPLACLGLVESRPGSLRDRKVRSGVVEIG